MKKEELKHVLEKSLSMEKEGRKFYLEGAEKIKNSLGRRMLLRLADDELNHINKINDIFASLSKNRLSEIQIEKPKTAEFKDIFERMKNHMQDAFAELTETGVDDSEIIHIALELEAHAKFYYEEASEKATDKTIKEFYKRLAVEEKSHYELLRNTHKYLENPALFFGMSHH